MPLLPDKSRYRKETNSDISTGTPWKSLLFDRFSTTNLGIDLKNSLEIFRISFFWRSRVVSSGQSGLSDIFLIMLSINDILLTDLQFSTVGTSRKPTPAFTIHLSLSFPKSDAIHNAISRTTSCIFTFDLSCPSSVSKHASTRVPIIT
ncbi:hypothetical protein YC2023_097143 [Brassica napus]